MSDLKSEILLSAAKLFAEKGFDKTSTREIAVAAKANISLISYHFGGKEGLYLEVMRSFARQMQEQLVELLNEIDREEITRDIFVREMGEVVQILIDMQQKHPEICQIFAREKLEGLKHSKAIHSEIFYPLLKRFFTVFERAQKKNIVRANVSAPLFFILLSEGVFGLFEAMNYELEMKKDFANFQNNSDLLKKQVLTIFLEGVLV